MIFNSKNNSIRSLLFLMIIMLFFNSCKESKEAFKPALFSLIESDQSNIKFNNTVKENLYFNFLNYPYIYNGGGVAVGDINNDGLEDIYFTSNQDSNKLYLNQGNFKFDDITESANVIDSDGWSTGVTMIDINNDGWLDIYVCKSGSLERHEPRKNKLYINQKNNTFKESAANYGLDFYGFSIQSHFFDMDNDGDLDLYIVNHRIDFRNNITIDLARDKQIEDYGSDQLFRNDAGKFVNVTNSSGIENKAWGLSASIGDFNNDGWLDVFVANDFFHSDYLYINNKNGTFTDQSLQVFNHLSNSSMGSDFEDINNDFQPDLIVLDMLAEDHVRAKNNMAAMNTGSFNMMVNAGYHFQYMANMLQLNNGNGTFSEIGQLAGIAKTDWSWAPLIADFDNDGFKDIFITNGIQNDLSNQDFRNQMRTNIMNRRKVTLDDAIKMIPSDKLQNYIYQNNGDLTFSNTSNNWGITQKINSNGSAYSDLDNDGDLDLIVNNQSEIASIYQNNSNNNFVVFSLKGGEYNENAIGSKISVYANNLKQSKELFTSRGYQSSVTHKLHFGLDSISKIDSVQVVWPNGMEELFTDIEINKTTVLNFDKDKKSNPKVNKEQTYFETVKPSTIGINYLQKENLFNDFDLQLLLPQKQSEISSPIAVADVNNDGLDDFFVGNAKDTRASLYIQTSSGEFLESNQNLLEVDKIYEDTNALFFDIDNDKDLDLYVASGGYEIQENSPLLQDRFYINDGKGNFKKSNALPTMLSNTKAITSTDFDSDGDIDMFIGGRVKHGKYPLQDKSYLLENIAGKLVDVTTTKIKEISNLRIINDAVFSDYDNDGDDDLIIAGEWMPITFFKNNGGQFIREDLPELKDSNGWYQTIKVVDFDNDGDDDYLFGNWGNNNKFHPTKDKPLHIYADYFDDNSTFDMALSKVSKSGTLIPVRGKECSSEQTPFLNDKIGTYNEFANATMQEIYGEELSSASHFEVYNFNSVLLKNTEKGNFEMIKLPNRAQFSPTLGIELHDINNDGYLDVFGVGNIYETEVETIRYDASNGYILFGGEKGNYSFNADTSYLNNYEAKAIKKIIINNTVHFIILNKNNKLTFLKLTKSGLE